MPLVRALVTAFLIAVAFPDPAQGGSPAFDPPGILIPSEEIQARGIKVLAALLVALTANTPQGGVVPPDRLAEAEHLLATKAIRSVGRTSPMPPLPLRRIAGTGRGGRENAASAAKDYNILHTFSELPTIIRSPISHAFAAPCDRRKEIGWLRAEATETLGVACTGLVQKGERLKLSDGLHRRRSDSLRDVILGQNAPPSTDRMNLDGISRTNVPALFIANW